MKQFFISVILSLCLLTGCNDEKSAIKNNKAYLFYSQSCPHCHEARKYINEKYHNLDIIQIDIATNNGREMLFNCVKKFNLGDKIGVPLFCLGDNYIMGWSLKHQRQFDSYIKPFKQAK